MTLFGSVWSVIQHRTDTAYQFFTSLIVLVTIVGLQLTDPETPALRAVTVVSVFLSGEQWSWIPNTSEWITDRSEAIALAGSILMYAAAGVAAFQGSAARRTKAGATLLLGWILLVNSADTSFLTWALLVILFLLGSLMHSRSGLDYWLIQTGEAFLWLFAALLWFVIVVCYWFIGRTKQHQPSA